MTQIYYETVFPWHPIYEVSCDDLWDLPIKLHLFDLVKFSDMPSVARALAALTSKLQIWANQQTIYPTTTVIFLLLGTDMGFGGATKPYKAGSINTEEELAEVKPLLIFPFNLRDVFRRPLSTNFLEK